MFDIRKILVPVDFGDCSERGLAAAFELASRYDAWIEVLHVWLPPPYAAESIAGRDRAEELLQLEREDLRKKLLEMIAAIPGSKNARFEITLVSGAPREVILLRARSFDLVVMGTHGRRGLSHLVLGSVTESVVRESPTPVLVVNAHGSRS